MKPVTELELIFWLSLSVSALSSESKMQWAMIAVQLICLFLFFILRKVD